MNDKRVETIKGNLEEIGGLGVGDAKYLLSTISKVELELDKAKEVLKKIYFHSGVAGYLNDEWCEEVRDVIGLNGQNQEKP